MTTNIWVLESTTTQTLPLSVYILNFFAPYYVYWSPESYALQTILTLWSQLLNYELLNISFLKDIQLPNYLTTFLFHNYAYKYVYTLNSLVLCFFFTYSISFFLVQNISRLEKELNSIEDMFYYIIFSFCSIFFIYGFFFFYEYINTYMLFFYFYIISVYIIIILVLPVWLLLHYGFYFCYYLRGSDTTLSLIYELFLDYINIISFFLRILIQFIRLFLIALTIYTYNELFYEFNNVVLSSTSTSTVGWKAFILLYLHIFLEYAHLLIIFFAQLATFFGMLLWLVQFLFTMFSKGALESFFFLKRNL